MSLIEGSMMLTLCLIGLFWETFRDFKALFPWFERWLLRVGQSQPTVCLGGLQGVDSGLIWML